MKKLILIALFPILFSMQGMAANRWYWYEALKNFKLSSVQIEKGDELALVEKYQ